MGVSVTAEVTPHHLTLTDEAALSFDTNTKVAPPLRSAADVLACREGLVDGTIEPRNYLLGFNENGLGLAGYGKFESRISAADKATIRQLIADIKAGKVKDLPKIR